MLFFFSYFSWCIQFLLALIAFGLPGPLSEWYLYLWLALYLTLFAACLFWKTFFCCRSALDTVYPVIDLASISGPPSPPGSVYSSGSPSGSASGALIQKGRYIKKLF